MARNRNQANERLVPRAALVVCLVAAALLTVPGVAFAATEHHGEAWFVGVDRSGESIVRVHNGTAYVWHADDHRVNVSFVSNRSGVTYSVCPFTVEGEREGRPLVSCKVHTRVDNGSAIRSSFTVPNRNLTEGRFVIVLKRTFGGDQEPIDRRVLRYEVIERDGDVDGDGLTNAAELNSTWDLNFTSADTDGDGIGDRLEAREYASEYGVDPTKYDTDGDGFSDKAEVGSTNATDPSDYPGSTTAGNQSTSPTIPGRSSSTLMTLVFVGLLGITGVGAVVWRYRQDGDSHGDTHVPVASAPADSGDADEDPDLPHVGEGSPYPAPSPAHTPRRMPEDDLLLTDEDRVYNLVREHGGRMKQATIVEETDWSKSKVSRLLSRLDEQGDINKLRVGRGNVIYFDGAEPPAARNPFDETD